MREFRGVVFVFRSVCFGCREGRTRCCCMACSSTAPLLRSDCDPSLWVCGQVCVVSFLCTDANTLAPLLFALPSQMQTLEILPLVYLACLFLFPSLSPAISLSLSRFSSHLSSFSLLCKSAHFAINTVFCWKPRRRSERSCRIFEVATANILNSKDVMKIWAHLRDVKRLNLFFPAPDCSLNAHQTL